MPNHAAGREGTMSIGSKLKELRVAKGQSLQQVADAVGASKPHIWELEAERSKNPSLDLLQRLAKHFAVSVAFFLDGDSESDSLVFGREFKGVTDEDKALILKMTERL